MKLRTQAGGRAHDAAKYIKNCEKCQINKQRIKRETNGNNSYSQHAFDLTSFEKRMKKENDITEIDTIKTARDTLYAVTTQCELTNFVQLFLS